MKKEKCKQNWVVYWLACNLAEWQYFNLRDKHNFIAAK